MASEAETAQMRQRITELEQALTNAENRVKAAADQVIELGNPGRRGIGALTSKRSFAVLDKWDGKEATFEPWQWKMRCFLQEEQGWGELLRLVEDLKTEPTNDTMMKVKEELVTKGIPGVDVGSVHETVNLMNKQLYQVLTMNLMGDALAPIKLRAEDFLTNGVACWWKMAKDNIGMTPQRLQSLAKIVLQPTRVRDMKDVSSAIDKWETAQKEYVKFEGKGDMSDVMKVTCVRGLVPVELENDVVRCSNTLRTYVEVRNYIVEQATIRKDQKSKAQNGPVPMDIDMVKKLCTLAREVPEDEFYQFMEGVKNDEGQEDQGGVPPPPEKPEGGDEEDPRTKELYTFMMKNAYQGGQRKGGGKGKGGFDGNCSHCGAYGHRLRECFKKDREMDAMRAGKGGGKGSKGGYGSGGKGGYQPNYGWGKGGWNGGKGWGGQKGGWKGYGKGDGKGQGKAMGLGYGYYGGNYDGSGQGAWTLNALTRAPMTVTPKQSPGEEEWMEPKKPVKSWKPKEETIDMPPGLSGAFDVLRSTEVDAGKYNREFPVREEERPRERHKMPRMINYSKGQVRKMQMGKPAKRSLFMLQRAQEVKPLNPFLAPKPDSEGWVKVKGVMDSGASESVAPPTMCPHYPVVPSAGSMSGQKYLSAGEELIDNLGEQTLEIMTEDGGEGRARYQVAEVSRPLNAVSEICDAGGDAGQMVVFTKWGGEIYNMESGRRTAFGREDGVYVWEFWVKPKEGFHRQG